MKITVDYEDKNHPTILNVPDEECEIWIENDYQRRLSEAEDPDSVVRRTAQEIMDEDFNKPTFNNNQTETRRHVHYESLDPEGKHLSDGFDILESLIQDEELQELFLAIEKLQPQQKELLFRVYWNGERQNAIAEEFGVSNMAITNRMKKIIAQLRKNMS